ncbi:hypothetical protein DNU06_10215 [Putridiphycobacter roseus]|uniref:Secretion system C-terminal sorting domain-containing protein n=1 Tax=Putridiphycobacter roseus TaxID=2219161 RepID=A0A2W1NR05_9FLAO|nr:gliding motility-associated C-terminal domain-containing protein [Putridiphycobacter roseus]PZE17108.1 hypothetical protein DNU06_10215 [Putridiphycobacter roseus]
MSIKSLLPLLFIFLCSTLNAKDIYWVGQSGDWDNPKNWSLSSGGVSANLIPTSDDDVIFDENSFGGKQQTVVFKKVAVNSFSLTNANTPVFKGAEMLIYKGFTLKSNVLFQTKLIFSSNNNKINTIHTNGYTINSDVQFNSGKWQLKSHLSLSDKSTLFIKSEEFHTNGFGLKAGIILAENSKLFLEGSPVVPLEKISFTNIVKKGGDFKLYELNADVQVSLPIYSVVPVYKSSNTCGALTVNWDVTTDYNGKDISCNGACDGELTVSTSGSTGPFSYKFAGGPATTTTVYPGLCPGNYSIQVTDTSNVIIPGFLWGTCTIDEDVFEPSALSLTVQLVINPSCHNVCDAQAFVEGVGGVGTTILNWSNGEIGQYPDSLCFGNNVVTLTDSNGCTLVDTVEILAPTRILFDVTVVPPTCNGDADAEIIISNESGGNGGPFTYSYAPVPVSGQNTNHAIGYAAGNVTVTISDMDGCPQDTIVTIIDPPIFTSNFSNVINTSCFGVCDGSIAALPAGGVPGYTYVWYDDATGLPIGNTDSIATGLCAGDYYVVITDANGCEKTSGVANITSPSEITYVLAKLDLACQDSCTGRVSVIASGGTATYNYNWNNITENNLAGTAPSLTDLCAGKYEITVTDANGCVGAPDTLEVINGLPIDIVFTSINPICYDICNGEITATPTNGTGFTYLWSNSEITQTISSLCVSGNYIVEVTTDSGCVEIDTFNFAAPDIYDITVNQGDINCYTDVDGFIAVNVNVGGNGPVYSYDWTYLANPLAVIDGDFTDSIYNLLVGTYEVVINDGAGGCDTTLSFTIASPPELFANTADPINLTCNGVCTGQISALPSGGMPPYTFQWFDNITGLPIGNTDSIATGLCAGTYHLVVTDANNCFVQSAPVVITEPDPIVLSLSKVDLVCFDVCEGEVAVSIIGGTSNYTVTWENITTSTPAGSGLNLLNLCAGKYEVTVVDANGCNAEIDTIEVLNALPIDVNLTGTDPTCFDVCDGSISLTTVNSSGFTYVWSPAPITGQGTTTVTDLCAAINYVVTVTDVNGCIEKDSLTFNEIPLYDITVSQMNLNCFSNTDGSISLTVNAGGNGGTYNYVWSSIPVGPITGQGTANITNLSVGDYSVVISDGLSCDTTLNFTITSPPELIANTTDVIQVSCNGLCDGQISVLPSGGTPGYSYEWIDFNTNAVISNDSILSNLCAGTYYVRVTDNNGCIDSSSNVIIIEPTPIVFNAQAYPISCFGICDGAASISVSGGSSPYIYTWTNISNNSVLGANDSISGLCPGLYEIVITDATGCSTEADTVEVLDVLPLGINLTGTDPTCVGICDGTIIGTAINGIAPFIWSTIPSSGQGTATATYDNLCGDFYTITLADDNGCIIQDTITLDDPTPYDITILQNDLNCYGDNSGSIAVTVNSGGSGVYTYNWLPAGLTGAGTGNVTNLAAGPYQLSISDGSCDTTLMFNVAQPDSLSVSASLVSNSFCDSDCNGAAEVTISGGTAMYNILWNDPANQSTILATDLCPGTYQVQVTDAKGCVKTDDILILEPTGFTFTTSTSEVSCFGECNGSASIDLLAGGTPAYTIQWDDPNNQTGPVAIGLCAGIYHAIIKDANNCDSTITVTITEPAEILFTTTINDTACFGSCDGELSVTLSGGVGPFDVNWFNVNNNISIGSGMVMSSLCPGEYYAEIIDFTGCSIFSDTLEIVEFPQININTTAVTNASCGLNDGAISINANGGGGTFVYDWNPTPITGQGTNNVTQLAGGIYQVIVSDVNACTDSLTVPVESGALEILNLDSTDVSCFGLIDGSVNVSYVCIEPTCMIEWFNEGGVSLGSNNAVTGLGAGIYYIQLTNGLGCTKIDSIVVNEPVEIIGTISSTDILCNGANTGTADVVASGGQSNLFYTWSPVPGGGQNTPNAQGLSAGIWTVTIADINGCSIDLSTEIEEPSDLVITNTVATPITCAGEIDGTVNVTVTGGTPIVGYEWFSCASGLSVGTTQSLNNLAPGDYFVVVTDGNGCIESSSCITVENRQLITGITGNENVSCYGDCNGLAYVTASGGTGTYFYQWQDDLGNDIVGQTNDTIRNLCRGLYFVEVMDGNGCTATFGPIDLTQPDNPWDVVLTTTDASCFSICDASAQVNVLQGNTAPYNYQWNDPLNQSSASAINLCAGTYDVVITDQANCDTTLTVLIQEPDPIALNQTQTNINCFDDCNGMITINPSGGTGPYSANWTGGFTGLSVNNLCAGPITVNVLDNLGCAISQNFNIIEPVAPLSIQSSFTNVTVCNQCNGSATVNVSGGSPNYTYTWSQAGVTGQGTNHVSGLCSGFISVTVTDNKGCTITQSFVVEDIDADDFTLSHTDASCFGVCDGTAVIVPTCTVPTCTQIWIESATGTILPGTGTSIANLCQGAYIVQLTNGAGCISADTFTVLSPSELIVDAVITEISCIGANDASIVVTPSGSSGTGFMYNWNPVPSNGANTNSALNIGTGAHTVTVTDDINCSVTETYIINDTLPIVITTTSNNVTCNSSCDGNISSNVTGGFGNYTYQWYLNGTPLPGGTTPNIIDLCPGDYTLDVTDMNGCTQSLTTPVTITEPSAITVSISDTDINCFGSCDGTATVVPTGGVGPYITNWYLSPSDNLIGQTLTTASNLCAGDYYATVTDVNNCTVTSSFANISEPTELQFTITENSIDCFDDCSGSASIVVTGGMLNYTYIWLDQSSVNIGNTDNVSNLCAGGYTVEVLDANGCSIGVQNINIISPSQITITALTNNAECNVASGSATAIAQGGLPTYTYQWLDNAQSLLAGETNATLSNVFAGTYFVVVKDANLCEDTLEVTIIDNPSTTLVFDAVNSPSCHDGNDGNIQITVVGNNMPLNYLWNPGGIIVEDPSNLTAGTYQLTITDALGCISYYDTVLVNPTEIQYTPTIVDPTCGQCDGELSVLVTGGDGNYDYLWNNGPTTNSMQNLCAGIYELNLTDGNGCEIATQYALGNSVDVSANAIVTPITCNDACDGEITVDIVNGTAPFVVTWLHDNSNGLSKQNLCEGTYFIEVKDANGCLFPLVVELVNPSLITVTETMVLPTCGLTDGSISILSEGGVLPHTYLWNTTQTTPVINTLGAGFYSVVVTDNNGLGCSKEFTFELSNVTVPQIELTKTDLVCNGVCDGSVEATVTGGTPGYIFQWYNGNGVSITPGSGPVLSNICAGEYTLEVTDFNGCIAFASEIIEQPDSMILNTPIKNNVGCNGDCSGSIDVLVLGGEAPYSFLWDDANTQTTSLASDLCIGTYTLTITDQNGCAVTITDSIIEPDPLLLSIDNIVSSHCKESLDGAIDITISGGAPIYNVVWTSSLNEVFVDEDLSNVLPGTYYLTVTDQNDCMVQDTAAIDTAVIVYAYAGLDTALCYGLDLLLVGTSNQPAADFTWFDVNAAVLSDTNELIQTGLETGDYMYVLYALFDGCDDYDTVLVSTFADQIVDAGEDVEIQAIGSIGIGGDPTSADGVSFIWSPAIYLNDTTLTNPTVIKPKVDNWYYVEVLDSNGCSKIDSMYVEVIPELKVPNGVSPNNDGKNDVWNIDFVEDFPNLEVWVYNRWGELLFNDNDGYKNPWDGQYKGKPLPVGTYYYVIELNNIFYPEPLTGPVTIMR